MECKEWHDEEHGKQVHDVPGERCNHAQYGKHANDKVFQPVERHKRRCAPAENEHRKDRQQVHQENSHRDRIAIGSRNQVRIKERLHSISRLGTKFGMGSLVGS